MAATTKRRPASNKKKPDRQARNPAKKKEPASEEKEAVNIPVPLVFGLLSQGAWAVLFFLLAVFSGLGYFDVKGIVIHWLVEIESGFVGIGFFVVPPMLLVCCGILTFSRKKPVLLRTVCALLVPALVSCFYHTAGCGVSFENIHGAISGLWASGVAHSNGGLLGGGLAVLLVLLVGRIGGILVLCVLSIFVVMVLTETTPAMWLVFAEQGHREGKARRQQRRLAAEEAAEREEEPISAYSEESEPHPRRNRFFHPRDIDVPDPVELAAEEATRGPELFEEKESPLSKVPALFVREKEKLISKRSSRVKSPDELLEREQPAAVPVVPLAPQSPTPIPVGFPIEAEPVPEEAISRQEQAKEPTKKRAKATDPAELAEVAESLTKSLDEPKPEYIHPPVELLKQMDGGSMKTAKMELDYTQQLLDDTIHSFGIDANIQGRTRGPSVTRYELKLEQGVKLSKITNLAGDIALSLGVVSVRIAPIPGKNSVVGVEVPNRQVSPVPIHDVIDSPEFRGHKSNVCFAVGKDISNRNIVGDISRLPHLLIAGTTGSGKSVCTNSLIISMLYKSSPEDVRLIMVDPKMVELGIYNGIPHLLIPVVTDPKKAAGALQWAVYEMLERYRLFAEESVRDLSSYNAVMKGRKEKTKPQIVVVIDELADLMLVAAKEVEESICRVAQMGRAAGMHLVIATQRPSADVITGLMKANIPSRIAFAVASSMESRIILDTTGAEKLVGKGDMLYAPLGSGKPQRVQGCLISDHEVSEIVSFIKQNSTADYDDNAAEQVEKFAQAAEKGGKGGASAMNIPTPDLPEEKPDDGRDALFNDAVEVVIETGMASVSMLQRRLKLGYSRAARLVDQMEEAGVVGPFEGSKPRKVLVSKEKWREQQMQMGGSQSTLAMAKAMNDAAGEQDIPFDMDET